MGNLESKGAEIPRRKLVCLAGLPIDVITQTQALDAILAAIRERRRLFLSTPNLNFMIAAQADASFRDSILHSDLSVADGTSLVLLAKLLGCKLPERVTGSDLFEQLARGTSHPPVKVFFFGGPAGAGAKAAERIRQEFPGVVCVGHDEAGFGDVASMSTQATIDRINASGADMVVVALGAKKGQAWLMHNRHRLHAPVISHLGAVINFMAGTVRRSPKWLQNLGLEWVWRISQEPTLWRRYRDDGSAFLSLLAHNVLGGAWLDLLRRLFERAAQPAVITLHRVSGAHRTLALSGDWSGTHVPELEDAIGDALSAQLILQEANSISPAVLGAIVGLHGQMLRAGGAGISMGPCAPHIARQIRSMGADYLQMPQSTAPLLNQEA